MLYESTHLTPADKFHSFRPLVSLNTRQHIRQNADSENTETKEKKRTGELNELMD